MGKMKDLSIVLDELKKCGETLVQISEDLRNIFSDTSDAEPVTPVKEEAPPKNKPDTKKPEIKKEQVRAVLAEKSRAGFTQEIKELLKKYGANKLSEVDPTNYEALLQEAEVLAHE